MNRFKLPSCFKHLSLVALVLLASGCNRINTRLPAITHDYCADIITKPATSLTEQLAPIADKMKDKTGVYVLEQSTEALLTRAWLTEYAEKTIDVQYFIFSTDNIGLIASDYLIQAADRGVKVRILVDDIMIDARGDELLLLDAHENLSVRIYNPMANLGKNIFQKVGNLVTDFHGFNQRMHNKTFTVDGKVSITGGRNIADEYFGYDHAFNFRDRDVLLIGGEVKTVQHSFNEFWSNSLSVPVDQLVKQTYKKPSYDPLHQYACDPDNFLPEIREQIYNMPETIKSIQNGNELFWLDNIEYVSDKPGKNEQNKFLAGGGLSTQRLIELSKSAKQSITIQTPYLITTKLSENLFKELIDNGVRIKILTNSLASNDNFEAFNGYQRVRNSLLKIGVEIYEFKPDAQIRKKVISKEIHRQLKNTPIFTLHAKSMVIDDNITVIATFNLDPRSANLNTESITVIPSAEISRQVKAGMLVEMQPENAWRTTLDWNPDHLVKTSTQIKVKTRSVIPKSIL
ncbi:MAG: phospholipase D family protein [Psychromonas sp.]|nr:phospholipase D family protein [Alteromonadales bacterium]MCP5079514.1 phospholipase D family protein [Psychromonas sp.]